MSYEITNEQLNSRFKSALADAEELVKATADMGDENISRLRKRAAESLQSAKVKMADAQEAVRAKATAAADVIDSKVRENPWEAIGIGAAAGLVVGVIAGILIARD